MDRLCRELWSDLPGSSRVAWRYGGNKARMVTGLWCVSIVWKHWGLCECGQRGSIKCWSCFGMTNLAIVLAELEEREIWRQTAIRPPQQWSRRPGKIEDLGGHLQSVVGRPWAVVGKDWVESVFHKFLNSRSPASCMALHS